VLTDAAGLPLAVAVSAAHTHDSLALIPLVQAIPAVRSRRGDGDRASCTPTRVTTIRTCGPGCADAASPRGSTARGVENSTRLGRHRWVVERSFAWLTGHRRLTLRYERSARLFTAFFTLAAALTCCKKLAT
jgi:transposase